MSNAARIDDVIAGYLKLRGKIEEIKERHSAELAPFNQKKELIESYLLAFLHTAGMSNVAAKGIGTAYKQDVVSVTIKDWDATLGWIRQNNAWEFLERRVSKTVVQEYASSQNALPPGVDVSTTVEVRVRKG